VILHPLFSYPTILLAIAVFSMYILSFLFGRADLRRYALYGHALLSILLIFTVISGFKVANVPLVVSKTPFLWGFPHKWNGIFLTVFSLLSFIYFWLKAEGSRKMGVLLALFGLLIVLFQFITGWMLRLVFFY
jgi:predicted neutral ceramidase superfamily lipid hydrolase